MRAPLPFSSGTAFRNSIFPYYREAAVTVVTIVPFPILYSVLFACLESKTPCIKKGTKMPGKKHEKLMWTTTSTITLGTQMEDTEVMKKAERKEEVAGPNKSNIKAAWKGSYLLIPSVVAALPFDCIPIYPPFGTHFTNCEWFSKYLERHLAMNIELTVHGSWKRRWVQSMSMSLFCGVPIHLDLNWKLLWLCATTAFFSTGCKRQQSQLLLNYGAAPANPAEGKKENGSIVKITFSTKDKTSTEFSH